MLIRSSDMDIDAFVMQRSAEVLELSSKADEHCEIELFGTPSTTRTVAGQVSVSSFELVQPSRSCAPPFVKSCRRHLSSVTGPNIV